MTGRVLCFLAASAVAGCGSEPGTRVAESDQTIVNGEIDTADPATVALTLQGQTFCSGTLVSTRVVVTAAHCVSQQTVPVPLQDIEVYFGNDVSTGIGTFIPAIDGGPHPDWDINNADPSNDVGVLRIFEDGPATPTPMAAQPFDGSFIGKQVRLIGFGITVGGGTDAGTKRQTTSAIDQYDVREFGMPFAPSGTCNGDSGGTALIMEDGQEVLAGIHSLSDCQSYAVDERVDVHVVDFIQPFIDAEPEASCNKDGLCAKGCAAIDPDCPCAADGFCTPACTDPATDQDCVAKCGADGECIAEGCAVPDPDCKCQADGKCDSSCPDDPDCTDPCAADGVCHDGCEPRDPDCPELEVHEETPPPEDDSGCGCALPGRGAGRAGAFGALALLLALSARRRRPL